MRTLTLNSLTAGELIAEPASTPRFGSSFARMGDAIRSAVARQRQRRQLASLDDGILRDLGVEADEIGRIRAGVEFTPRAWM